MTDTPPPDEPGSSDEGIGIEAQPPIWAVWFVRLFAGAGLGGFLSSVTWFEVLHRQPPMPGAVLTGVIVAGAIVVFLIPLPAFVRAAAITPDGITFVPSRGPHVTAAPESIAMVAARRGLSFAGGEIVAPKSIRVLTPDGQFDMKFEPQAAPEVFEVLADEFPRSVRIDFDGRVTMPDLPADVTAAEFRDLIHSMVDDEFHSRASRAKWASLLSLIGAVAAGVGAAATIMSASSSTSSSGPRLGVAGVVLLVASILCVGDYLRVRRARARVQAAADREWGG
jgi:hypothetical protein